MKVGNLVKFSCDKRELYFPSSPLYKEFDKRVGLVISNSKNSNGEHVRVQWLKPFPRMAKGKPLGGLVKYSDFNALNFEIVGSA